MSINSNINKKIYKNIDKNNLNLINHKINKNKINNSNNNGTK